MPAPHIHILLCTHDGAAHLRAQLQSYLAQEHADWSLWVSDDASSDETRAIVTAFAKDNPDRQVRLFDGPAQGSAANYLSLLLRPEMPAGWLAFSDQDDVWMPGKLRRAVTVMAEGPQVYASRTILTTADGTVMGPSVVLGRGPSFENALVQNILAGNTLVLDSEAASALKAMSRAALAAGHCPPYHDWWTYLALTGAGLPICNDLEPGLYYRQHENNHLGAHRGLRAGQARMVMLRDRHFAGWIGANLAALGESADLLTPPNRALLEGFAALQGGTGGVGALRKVFRLGLRRQSKTGDLVLAILALTGRL